MSKLWYINQAAMGGGAAPLVYLLRDIFTDTVAAGSVNGTAPTPGPGGNRAVVDTANKLSIGGGVVTMLAQSTPDLSDPILQYPAITRAAGRVIVFQFNVASVAVGKDEAIGFAATAAYPGIHSMYAGNYSMLFFDSGYTDFGYGDLAASTNYQLAIALRATGAFFFLKGGTGKFANPVLLRKQDTINTASLIPTISAYANNLTSNDIHIVDRLLLPTPLASDGFGGAATVTDGAGHAEGVSGGIGAGGAALAWTDQVGASANGSGVRSMSLTGGIGISTVDCGKANTMIQMTLPTLAGGVAGGVARYVDADNHLRFYSDGSNVFIDQVVAGVVTNLLTSSAIVHAAGKKLYLRLDSTTTAWLYFDSHATQHHPTSYLSTTAIPAALQTATKVGVYTTHAGNTFDDFTVYDHGGSEIYQPFFTNDNPVRTILVPDGENINWYASMCQASDTLKLALTGAYTQGATVDGLATLPSGVTVNGNGSTVTAGNYAAYLISKSNITFLGGITWVDQTIDCIHLEDCHNIICRNITMQNTLGYAFNDFFKFIRVDYAEFYDCTILPSTGVDSSDGFELYGPCSHVLYDGCDVQGIDTTAVPRLNNAFEFYGYAPTEICNDVHVTNCKATDVIIGVAVIGEDATHFAVHTNIVIDHTVFTRCHKAIQVDHGSTFTSDYNTFADCDHIGSIDGVEYDTLAAWQAATGQDLHSTES